MISRIAMGDLQATENGNINLMTLKTGAYYTPSQGGAGIVKSLNDVCTFQDRDIALEEPNVNFRQTYLSIKITLIHNNTSSIIANENYSNENQINTLFYKNFNATLNDGLNILKYEVRYTFDFQVESRVRDFILTYNIYIANPKKALPKWNAWTVCERLLKIAEPLRENEAPRFKLDENQKAWLESIETPEFQFTQSNLRECLQGVGSYIHAEPRLNKNKIDGEFVISFDKYGGNVESEFANEYEDYASATYSRNLESFATNIDSSADNFVNSLNQGGSGTITEPFVDGYKTVLTESVYARIQDNNMYIATQYPIRSVKSLKFGYVPNSSDSDWAEVNAEITPYVFESAEYQKLSSYDTQYPNSKAYAIYYTIGEKGIHGLNFKQEDLFQEWKNYSIVNILKSVLGDFSTGSYWALNFQIEYVPIYPARVQQNKSYVDLGNIGKEWTRPYTQGQNLIESQYFGENLKGVIARMGNIDKTITYVIPDFPMIQNQPLLPKIGELYDNDYYISSTAIELQPYYTKITLALSKDFNKYNEYIGINSVKRMYEISERQAFDSEISLREFCVFADSDEDIEDSENTLLKNFSIPVLQNLFYQLDIFIYSTKIAYVEAVGYGYDKENLGIVYLPVIASSFGNACILSFKYEDNYSAGNWSAWAKIVDNEGVDKGAGYFTETKPYTDVYGRINTLSLDFKNNANTNLTKQGDFLRFPPNGNKGLENEGNKNWLKGNTILSTGENRLLVEKGNTEVLSFNYQLEFITTREDIIIGSGLARNITLIRNADIKTQAKLIYFKNRLNKFDLELNVGDDDHLDESFKAYTNIFNTMFSNNTFKPYKPSIPNSSVYKAWALVSPQSNGKYELLIGCNMTIDRTTQDIFAGNGHSGLKIAIMSEKDLYK